MRIPPGIPLELQRCLRDIQNRIDRLGATHGKNTNLAGNRVTNAGKAERFGEYTTLEQVIDIVRTAVAGVGSGSETEADAASGASGGGGGGGGIGPPTGNFCTTQPLSANLPGWFREALLIAGVSTNQNCYDPAALLATEATCNNYDFTLQRDSGCNVRGRLYHQANHGIWGSFCGFPDASAVADAYVDVVVTNADGSVSWGWV